MPKTTPELPTTREEVEMLFKLVQSETAAYKNWIASAIEVSDRRPEKIEYARKLVVELRKYEALFAKLNGYLNPIV